MLPHVRLPFRMARPRWASVAPSSGPQNLLRFPGALLTVRVPKAQCAGMTIALAVAAAVAFGLALGSLMHQVDGATLRRWRLSRRWDVPRLAREFIKAADEPLATVRGLTHMINAWERGARRPSERYWLLYLRVFPECVSGETANGAAKEAGPLAGIPEIYAIDAATLSPSPAG